MAFTACYPFPIMIPSSLKRIHSVSEAPCKNYLFYDLSNGIYHLPPTEYHTFTLQWLGVTTAMPALTLDLASTVKHSLIFDLDFKYSSTKKIDKVPHSILHVIEFVLKRTFLPSVPHFTYILCRRGGHPGIHIHLPEFEIGHDDYIILCESLQEAFKHKLDTGDSYHLDILANAMLSGAAKPNQSPYKPILVVYVDEHNSFQAPIHRFEIDFEKIRPFFKQRKQNAHSLFRQLLSNHGKMVEYLLKQILMPINSVQSKPNYVLTYSTLITDTIPTSSFEHAQVAKMILQSKDFLFILKGNQLLFNGKHLLRAYCHLELTVDNIHSLDTRNRALRNWFKRFSDAEQRIDMSHIPDLFRELFHVLRKEHPFLVHDPNPLKSVMEYNRGYFFLPVFYALHYHFQMRAADLVEHLYACIDTTYHPLLDRLKYLDEQEIPFIFEKISLNTLHFCCNHMYEKPQRVRDKLQIIVKNNQRAILSVTTHDQIVNLVRNLQEKHFPIKVLYLRNNLKKPTRYVWNFLTESWQEMVKSQEVIDHIVNLWMHIKTFLINYRLSGGLGGPDEQVYERFNVQTVVSTINSDTILERQEVQMDSHKWFLRLNDGMLDLLTGHIGAVVPEFFMSDRKMGIDFTREHMMALCHASPHLETLYAELTDRTFHLQFMKAIFTDWRGLSTLFDMALALVRSRSSIVTPDPLVLSMIHFFVHIHIYMSFEYDMYLYLMDVLASIFIATNYERKFVVCKGLTRNGKSMLFEVLKRVFGGYYYGIQSENLMPVHASHHPTPELASSLFSGRIVACEELEGKLNENRVKQITGNSHVSFRNMYESHQGGIPTAKVFASTNNYPQCQSSHAFRDRTIAIPFDANFVDVAPDTVSQQVWKNQYWKSTHVLEESYKGCFLMLYYHLQHALKTSKDGFLHYRNEPLYIQEFTEEYLIHTDIYIQFKVHMDIQIIIGSMVTLNDVKSAMRQFVKAVKCNSSHENDLMVRFESEFREHRRTDTHLDPFAEATASSTSNLLPFSNHHFEEEEVSMGEGVTPEQHEEEEPLRRKKKKMKFEKSAKRHHNLTNAFVFYENVCIKNFKQQAY